MTVSPEWIAAHTVKSEWWGRLEAEIRADEREKCARELDAEAISIQNHWIGGNDWDAAQWESAALSLRQGNR